MNTYRGGIARKFQLFHRYNSLLEDNYLHFNIIGDIPQLYARDCTEKVILCVQKYESVQRCNKWKAILNTNEIKSIKSVITRSGENYERQKQFLIHQHWTHLKFFSLRIWKETLYLNLNQAGMFLKIHIVSSLNDWQ